MMRLRKSVLFFSLLLLLFLFSCKKNCGDPPVIVLNDGIKIKHPLNKPWEEPGYLATDCKGNDITYNVKITNNVNVNLCGTYDVVYEVSDEDGNKNSAKREILVYNQSEFLAGNYSVHSIVDSTYYSDYTIATILADNSTNNRIIFVNYAGFTDANIYAIVSDNQINIPLQSVTCGSGSNRFDRTFRGTGIVNNNEINITGTFYYTGGVTIHTYKFRFYR